MKAGEIPYWKPISLLLGFAALLESSEALMDVYCNGPKPWAIEVGWPISWRSTWTGTLRGGKTSYFCLTQEEWEQINIALCVCVCHTHTCMRTHLCIHHALKPEAHVACQA